jgi:hypothetical protein
MIRISALAGSKFCFTALRTTRGNRQFKQRDCGRVPCGEVSSIGPTARNGMMPLCSFRQMGGVINCDDRYAFTSAIHSMGVVTNDPESLSVWESRREITDVSNRDMGGRNRWRAGKHAVRSIWSHGRAVGSKAKGTSSRGKMPFPYEQES